MGRGMLILTAGFLIVVGIIQVSISNRQKAIPEQNTEYFSQAELQNISHSLSDYAVTEVEEEQSWDEGYNPASFLGAQGKVDVFTYDDYQSGNSDIPSDNEIDNWGEYTILIVSQVEKNGYTTSTQVVMTKDAFSKYTYFTDREASNIYFYSDDVLEGPVHTNGTMKIAGSPTFKGRVTSPNKLYEHPWYDNNPDFQADSNFSAQNIPLPLGEGIDKIKAAATNGGLKFTEDIFAEFKTKTVGNDTLGEVDISEVTGYDASGNPQYSATQTYDISSFNGVISSTKKIFTKGTVRGQVSLHSEKQVEIMGDIEYSADPTVHSNSKDLLGIVSEGDVILDQNAHKDHGSQDVNIHASILAIDESFSVEGYSSGNSRGTLNLLGGLQQKTRGAVGTFNSSGISSGFNKSYSYDKRLLGLVPPAYPRESFFSKVSWKEKPVRKIN